MTTGSQATALLAAPQSRGNFADGISVINEPACN
jgi:hypothetical protein